MRKVREDITAIEAFKEWEKSRTRHGLPHITLEGWMKRIVRGEPYVYFPDSFYEQPPVDSYGCFWDGPKPERPTDWGYLSRIDTHGWKYRLGHGEPYSYFEPGIPQDVDENGMPK